jgi:hypothetical protein
MKLPLLAAVAAFLLGAGFVGGYYLHSPEQVVEYRDRVVTKRVTEHTKTTTPDGAVVERTTERESSDVKPDEHVKSYRPDYSVGARWYDMDTPAVELGYRVLGNLWLEGGYDIKRKEPSVGLRVNF